ncbi:unnamed protein product [Urochloa decumbens]|uniref:Mixed lineage kinase domain-containing protein n=1 Tax=Urochloa decumbens TaxID=240449 RepID=A0ABC9D6P1_9POAL
MVVVTGITGLISIGIYIADKVIRLAGRAQRNREKCRLLKKRVEMIRDLLTELQSQKWTPDPGTGKLLRDLNDAIDEGRALVESCQERRTWSLLFRTQKKAKKFDALGERISEILAMFHIANMNLIVKTNRNGGAAAAKACAPSSAGEVKKMVSMAVSIVEEAKKLRQNREEIQQLVQFVEQAAKQMQKLQSANLRRDPKTKKLLVDLQDLLQQADNILFHHRQPHRNNTRMAQAFSCTGGGYYSQDEPEQILEVAYRIEYVVQFLPLTIILQI